MGKASRPAAEGFEAGWYVPFSALGALGWVDLQRQAVRCLPDRSDVCNGFSYFTVVGSDAASLLPVCGAGFGLQESVISAHVHDSDA